MCSGKLYWLNTLLKTLARPRGGRRNVPRPLQYVALSASTGRMRRPSRFALSPRHVAFAGATRARLRHGDSWDRKISLRRSTPRGCIGDWVTSDGKITVKIYKD